jgi:hypothetical protein
MKKLSNRESLALDLLFTKAEETVLCCFSKKTAMASPWEKRGVITEPNLWSSAPRVALRLNETNLEDALQTKLQPELLGLERLHRHTAMGDKQAAKASEEMKDPNFLAKTFMTCLPVTGFDESSFDGNKRKPKWVEFNNKRAKVNY